QFCVECGGSLNPPFSKVIRNGKSHPGFCPHLLENMARKKVVLKTTPGLATINPYVTCFQAFPQMNEYGDFPRLQIGILSSMADTLSPFMGHKIERNLFG
ncbi:hypothetical protein WMC23_004795, partial [Escherichia coli]